MSVGVGELDAATHVSNAKETFRQAVVCPAEVKHGKIDLRKNVKSGRGLFEPFGESGISVSNRLRLPVPTKDICWQQ